MGNSSVGRNGKRAGSRHGSATARPSARLALAEARPLLVPVPGLDTETLAPLRPPPRQHLAASSALHTGSKPVCLAAMSPVGLKGPLGHSLAVAPVVRKFGFAANLDYTTVLTALTGGKQP